MATINDWCVVRWSDESLSVEPEANVGLGGDRAVRLVADGGREQHGFVVSRHGRDYEAAKAKKAQEGRFTECLQLADEQADHCSSGYDYRDEDNEDRF